MYKQRINLLIVFLLIFGSSFADEGLWIPKLIKEQEGKMKSLGMAITAEEIYNENSPSLKDAVLHFGGGCTAEIISDQGLILTNHHCGYSRIQSHSSLENNYLKDGFWAETLDDELPNPGLTVTRYVSMTEVTDKVMEGITSKMSDEEKAEKIEDNIRKIGKEATMGTHYNYQIRPFYEGNQFYLIVRETFTDIRLVGAPPSSIGKYGFDTDNWVWPRHTGDFSIFRVYVDKDNKPAEYSEDNVPYKPLRSLTISSKGVNSGDFTMVYGFPGTTYSYLYSQKLDIIINKALPLAIEMRENNLAVIDKAMRESEKVAIQYAAKQSRISNAWKKWIGQTRGLERFNAIEKKKELEGRFSNAVAKDKKLKKMYGELFSDFEQHLPEYEKYYLAYTLWREFVYYGPEIIRFVSGLENTLESEDSLETKKENLKKRIDNFYKNYVPEIDQALLAASAEIFFSNLDQSILEGQSELMDFMKDYNSESGNMAQELFSNSIFTNEERITVWADNYEGGMDKMKDDPIYKLMNAIYNLYSNQIKDDYSKISSRIDEIEKEYMTAQMKVLPEQKDYYPNANGTLRVSYGQVGGYEPMDAVQYEHMTTTDGILDKYIPGSYEYDLPEKLVTLLREKDFGEFSDEDNLPVCFIASNHTSGGNSGSPVFNANGELIGINFDRTWESTMSDMMFNPEICRNISVDMRYILFIVDKFAGANRLIEEMDIN
ncbi:S46 family peptidase [Hyphobacterium sp. CCMP332]|nr:S46 family peptidase [Hyphobacterium sp. CCMP332]